MSVFAGTNAVEDGLVLCLDAGNTSRSARGFKNILNLSSWTLGTGSASGNGGTTFNLNGTVAENQRILDTGPFGVSALVWDTPSNDATSDADGGWNSDYINIDITKLYRFSVWMRRKTIGDGSYYLGTGGFDSSNNNIGVLNRSNTAAVNTNLYFSAGGWPSANVPANSWMLVVGHIWPVGSGTGSDHADSGLWNTSGTKFSTYTSSGDAVWQTTNAKTWHRSYLYYSTITTTQQQWYQPRIDLCDGTEPSIADLIAGIGSNWYDLSSNRITGNLINMYGLYTGLNYFSFDGVDDYIDLGSTIQLSNSFTMSVWVKDGNTGFILDQGPIGTDTTGCVEWTNNGLSLGSNNIETVAATGTITTTVWNNIVVSFSSGSVKFYINGQLDSTKSMPSTSSFTPSGILKIGRRAFSTSANFSGKIAALNIYNRVLSDQEVTTNFNALRGRFGL